MAKKQNTNTPVIITIIVSNVVVLIGVLYGSFMLLNEEYKKVGGKENYQELMKLEAEQAQAFLDQRAGLEPEQPTQQTQPAQPTADLKISLDELAEIKEAGKYVKGNPDAKITWIEYSDLQCPACAALHNFGAIEQTFEANPDNVNMMVRHFPLRNLHPTAQMAAEAAECVGEELGNDAFFAFIERVFQFRNGFKSTFVEIAMELWMEEEKIEACIDDKRFFTKVDDALNEGQRVFGVSSTPTNVLINNETGDYLIVRGAAEYASFQTAIDQLLAK